MPQPGDAKAASNTAKSPEAARRELHGNSAPQMPTPSSPLSSPETQFPVFGGSPMTIRVADRRPLTPPRRTRMEPIVIDSSPDSFPPSPIFLHTASKVSREASLPSATSTSFSSLHRSLTDEIQDSDEDGPGTGSDANSESHESLPDAVYAAAFLSSSLSSAPASNTRARETSPSAHHGSLSAAPLVTKRCAAAAVLTSPLPRRRVKQPRASWQADPPPKHKFDMMALLRHAKQEDATDAAARRVSDIYAESEAKEMAGMRHVSGDSDSGKMLLGSAPLLDGLLDNGQGIGLADAGESKGAGCEGNAQFNKDRLRKALDRVEVAAVSESWYFFKEHYEPLPTARRPFPQDAAAPGSRWAFLRDPTLRQDYFMMGVVRKAIAGARHTSDSTDGSVGHAPSPSPQKPQEQCLPDEIFLWVLGESCVEAQPALSEEYAAVLGSCPEQIRRLVDAERVLHLFQELDPRQESVNLTAQLKLVPAIPRPYTGRDWSLLCSLLRLMSTLAGSLGLDAVTCAVNILLRLGIDRVIEEIPANLCDYQEAIRMLVQQVPRTDWNRFCLDIAISLHSSVQKPSLWWRVLACLPSDTPASHDMRRRLASAMFFNDPERARLDPRQQLQQVPGLATLADRDDLVLTPDTNFADLTALVDMLGVFLDDIGREAVVQLRSAPKDQSGSNPDGKDNAFAAAVRSFDANIDGLVRRLKWMGHGIESTGGGHIAQLDSKTAFERLQIRLTHSVRIRPRGRRSIFDGPAKSGTEGGEDMQDVTGIQQKQQDIRNFFSRTLSKQEHD
ncbi:hypothetical protein SEPCBS119000_001392 [Sporothrix epigloea]|uniref:Uncharacterized protein n=1 Tax=Sporothrix epigloea TaxID=1892477 RepID=A0ABP0DAF9_9PEZI